LRKRSVNISQEPQSSAESRSNIRDRRRAVVYGYIQREPVNALKSLVHLVQRRRRMDCISNIELPRCSLGHPEKPDLQIPGPPEGMHPHSICPVEDAEIGDSPV